MTWIAWLAPRLAGLWAVVILLWYAAIILVVNARGYDSWPSDFTVFWHAARLALAGDPTAAFNQASMADVWRFPDGTDLRADWLYPPTWLLLLLPFGALPFTPALILYGTCSVLALWLATRPAASTLPGGVFLVLASPAVPLGVHLSNTTLMMAAILAAALLFLSRDRPLLTSAAIAGFAIKPQLALAFPIALIASRSWLIIALSAICTAAFALIATFTFGVAYWERFLEKLAGNIEMLEGWEAMMI
ncbi:MAG: glycosyltransferase family 87 protein, partial [Pseudomonadota bacterium]